MENVITKLKHRLDAEMVTAEAFRYKLQKGIPGMTREKVNKQNKRATEARLDYEEAVRKRNEEAVRKRNEQNAAFAAALQAQFNAGNAQGINIPQNVQNAVVAAARAAALAPNAVGNANRNNEIRRARQRGADIAERLVKAKRVLIICAKYIKEGSIRKAKAFGEQAIKILNEVLKMVPPRRVIKDYIYKLIKYAHDLLAKLKAKNPQIAIDVARNVLGRLGAANVGGRRWSPPPYRNSNLSYPNKAEIRRALEPRIAGQNQANWENIGNIKRNNKKLAYAYQFLKNRALGANNSNPNQSSRARKVLRNLIRLPRVPARPVNNRANNYLNNNKKANNLDPIEQEPLEPNYIIIKHPTRKTITKFNPSSILDLLKMNGSVEVNAANLKNWLRMAKRNFPEENLFKHPIQRNWVKAPNIFWGRTRRAAGNGAGPSAANNRLNNRNLIRQMVNARLANLRGNSPGILAMLERLDQRIPEFQVCTILSRQADKLPIYKLDINTRILVLLRLILYRERITQALKNFIAREWPRGWTMQKNMNLRAIAQNIQGIGARSGVGLNLPRANAYNMGGTGMCHFEEIPFTNRGRKSREDRIDDIRKLFHGTCNRFLELRNAAPNKITWEFNTTRSFGVNASGGGPCVDNAVNALLTAIGGTGANNFRYMR